jgi:pyruvate dehydrogenase E2 component (dihydrolipoamide acetyltransferase)
VAIAGTGAIVRRVVVLTDNTTAVQPIMILSLTFDHRANDGLAAGRFSGAIRAALERMDLSRLED